MPIRPAKAKASSHGVTKTSHRVAHGSTKTAKVTAKVAVAHSGRRAGAKTRLAVQRTRSTERFTGNSFADIDNLTRSGM